LIGYYQIFRRGSRIMPHTISDKQGNTGLRCFLYDKTKGAQYVPIIKEDDKAQVKLLYDKTKCAQ
jgi:hypothetical protein